MSVYIMCSETFINIAKNNETYDTCYVIVFQFVLTKVKYFILGLSKFELSLPSKVHSQALCDYYQFGL